MVSFVFQTKKRERENRRREGKNEENDPISLLKGLRMELERENAASHWKIPPSTIVARGIH